MNKKSQESSEIDSEFESDDDFMVKNTKSANNFSRPTSSLSIDHKKKQTDNKSSDEESVKNNFKSGSTSSIASRLKNAVKSTFMASKGSKSSSKKSLKSNKKIEKVSDTDTSTTRTPSPQPKKSLDRPDTRLDHLSTSSDKNH